MSMRVPSSTKTLLIEDDPVLRRTLRAALEDEGFHPIECADLAHAREALAQMQPDVVVLDLSLGPEFGGTLLEELAQLEQAPAVVVCSAFPLAPLVAARFSVGCIRKPFELDAFVREVNRVMEQQLRPRRVSPVPLPG